MHSSALSKAAIGKLIKEAFVRIRVGAKEHKMLQRVRQPIVTQILGGLCSSALVMMIESEGPTRVK